jgi:hypothetical protein
MRQIQLPDRLYNQVKRRAADAGFSSVDDYVAEIVERGDQSEAPNFDHVFTPERIARLEQISAEIKAGAKTYTAAQVQRHFERKRKQWLKDHAS